MGERWRGGRGVYLVLPFPFQGFVFDDLQGRGTSVAGTVGLLVGFGVAGRHLRRRFERLAIRVEWLSRV